MSVVVATKLEQTLRVCGRRVDVEGNVELFALWFVV